MQFDGFRAGPPRSQPAQARQEGRASRQQPADENDCIFDRIEITLPHDGQAGAMDAQKVIMSGLAMNSGMPGEDFARLFKYVIQTCNDKSIKDYSDCSLVVAIAPMSPSAFWVDLYESHVGHLVEQMAQIRYKAKRVILFIIPDRIEVIHGM